MSQKVMDLYVLKADVKFGLGFEPFKVLDRERHKSRQAIIRIKEICWRD